MAQSDSGIQPSVLRWARESLHLSLEEVADRLKKDPSVVESWEQGVTAPTYSQLEKLAYELYKRPLAVFFFPEPPQEPDIKSEFRSMPDAEMEKLNWHTYYLIRQANSFKESLVELNNGRNPAEQKIFQDISLKVDSNKEKAASQIRAYLGISIDTQQKWRNIDQALKAWRDAIESVGIFVFKNSFRQRNVSAFCITDNEFPIIFLNNSTTKTRQIFSIFHELVHLLMHQSDVVSVTQFSVETLSIGQGGKVEEFCNALAAEVLLPRKEAAAVFGDGKDTSDAFIERIADRYWISREVVLRRMMEFGFVSRDEYSAKVRRWAANYQNKKDEGEGGGSYYNTLGTYLGHKYISLVFRRQAEGRITTDQAAEHLAVKPRAVAGLERFAYGEAPV